MKYSPLNPPKMTILLPTKHALCLLLALGNYILVFNAFIVLFSKSTTRISLRSLLNLPPKIYILFSYTTDECPHLVKKVFPLTFLYFHLRVFDPFFNKLLKSSE